MNLRNYLLSGVARNAAEAGGGGNAAGGGQQQQNNAGGGGNAAGGGQQQQNNAGGGGQQQQAPWYADEKLGLDDGQKQFMAGKSYPDLSTALKSLPEADRMARERNVIEKPDPKNLDKWPGWEALGWNRDLEKYEVKEPTVKQGQLFDKDLFNTAKQFAHKHKIPPSAFNAFYQEVFDATQERVGKMVQTANVAEANQKKELDTKLRDKWQDRYDANTDLARRAVQALGVAKEHTAELEKIIGSPALTEFFHTIGDKMGEDTIAQMLNQAKGGGGGDIHQLRAELAALQGDENFMAPLRDPQHALHKTNNDKRNALLERIARAQGAGS